MDRSPNTDKPTHYGMAISLNNVVFPRSGILLLLVSQADTATPKESHTPWLEALKHRERVDTSVSPIAVNIWMEPSEYILV